MNRQPSFDIAGMSAEQRLHEFTLRLDAVERFLNVEAQQRDNNLANQLGYDEPQNMNLVNIPPVATGINHNRLPALPPEINDNRNNVPRAGGNNLPAANDIYPNNLLAVMGGNNLPAANNIYPNNLLAARENIDLPDNFIRVLPLVNGLHEIGGLKNIKNNLHMLVVLPISQPQLFRQIKRCRTILLYGPPGTGKTRLVHALAAESGAVFLSLATGEILSSYVGETERNIQEVFDYIRTTETYTLLFIDEIDGLCRARTSSEADYARRLKTELMCQLNRMDQSRNCIIIAATNCPWDLDAAFLRRFQKQVFVPLPTSDERIELFQIHSRGIPGIVQSQEQLDELIRITDGFTGSDIANLVFEARHIPLNELQYAKLWSMTPDRCFEPLTNEGGLKIPDGAVIQVAELKDLPHGSVRCRPVTIADFVEAAKQAPATVTAELLQKYENYRNGKINQ